MCRRGQKLCLILMFFTFLSYPAESLTAESPVVLSEIMFDPSGSEFYDEYVEIFNTSETESVDLTGWTIGDGAEDDRIIEVEGETYLGPHQYGLILDSGYFENSDTYDPLPKDALILTIEDASFGKGGWSNSSAEPVILIDADGDTVAFYIYSPGNIQGRSDEKILLEGGDGEENWADSVVDGGTPGRQNSVFVQKLPSEVDMSISPNPFEDGTVISYRVPVKTALVNLFIYDSQGRLVRRLLNSEPSGAERSAVWDGADDEGVRLRMGIYIVYLEALNARKGVVYSVKKPVVLARRL